MGRGRGTGERLAQGGGQKAEYGRWTAEGGQEQTGGKRDARAEKSSSANSKREKTATHLHEGSRKLETMEERKELTRSLGACIAFMLQEVIEYCVDSTAQHAAYESSLDTLDNILHAYTTHFEFLVQRNEKKEGMLRDFEKISGTALRAIVNT